MASCFLFFIYLFIHRKWNDKLNTRVDRNAPVGSIFRNRRIWMQAKRTISKWKRFWSKLCSEAVFSLVFICIPANVLIYMLFDYIAFNSSPALISQYVQQTFSHPSKWKALDKLLRVQWTLKTLFSEEIIMYSAKSVYARFDDIKNIFLRRTRHKQNTTNWNSAIIGKCVNRVRSSFE